MLSLTQKLSQGQRLTPQQLQYLKLLQLSGVALEQRVKEELEINPLLEEQEGDALRDQVEGSEKEDIEWDDLMAGTWDPFRPTGSTRSEEGMGAPQAAEESLIDRILAQIRMSALEEHEVILAEEIVGNIDADGYLRRDLEEIVGDLNRFIAETDAVRLLGLESEEDPTSPFSSYAISAVDHPFGRDRLLFEADLSEAEPTVESHEPPSSPEKGEGQEPESVETDEPKRTIADLSLEEMADLPIEELARILERGTVASAEKVETNGAPADALPVDPLPSRRVPTTTDIFTLSSAEEILHKIQRLDPPAIGARSLEESLAIQLELLDDDTPWVETARRVIGEAYHEFTMKHFEKICKRIDCTEEELRDAIDLITTLNPKPGDGNSGLVETNYVTPDFVIERDGDSFIILPNDSFIPTLKINPGYKEMLAKKGKGEKGRKRVNVDRGTQKFLRQKMESAKWFIASIHQRRQTMLKVMEAILEMQTEFFRKGQDHLKPMIYRDIAEKISMDISTVCRVVNGKYVQTDFGVFELRYFFSEALETAWGEEVSNKVVKNRIRDMIDAEDKSKPLSDDAISARMKELGYPVARRTVAKYREQMSIPIARLRRAL